MTQAKVVPADKPGLNSLLNLEPSTMKQFFLVPAAEATETSLFVRIVSINEAHGTFHWTENDESVLYIILLICLVGFVQILLRLINDFLPIRLNLLLQVGFILVRSFSDDKLPLQKRDFFDNFLDTEKNLVSSELLLSEMNADDLAGVKRGASSVLLFFDHIFDVNRKLGFELIYVSVVALTRQVLDSNGKVWDKNLLLLNVPLLRWDCWEQPKRVVGPE